MRLVPKSNLARFCLHFAVCFAGVVQGVAIFLAVAPPHVKNNPFTLMRVAVFYAILPLTTFALGWHWAALHFTNEDEQPLARTAPRNYGSLGSAAR
jgi:hypothetical protein